MIRLLTSMGVLICPFAITRGQSTAQLAAPTPIAEIQQRLADGRTTNIVCFGDSITGAYYHTGSERAWCDMLGIALRKANPSANLRMTNAGISGHTTENALVRIDQDVIAKNPHLVVIMFGMNDVTRVPLGTYQANLREIIKRCQNAGAAVLLCTPNGVSANKDRPEQKLAEYASAVRSIAADLALPVADCLEQWQKIRSANPLGWSLLMSDAIHPNMNGHRRFAELIAESICGRAISLHEVPPPLDVLHHTFDRLRRNEAVRIVAMPPYDRLVPEELQRHFPQAKFEVIVWPAEDRTTAEMAEWAKQIRGRQPHLVIPAVPWSALSTEQETFIAEYEWILNWSFQFAGRPWDVIPVMPLEPTTSWETDRATELQGRNLANARRTLLGKDVCFIEREANDRRNAVDIVSAWIADQKRAWQGARNILPAKNASVPIPGQSWPRRDEPSSAGVSLHDLGGQLTDGPEQSGNMLTSHNWNLVTSDAGWQPRDSQGEVVFDNQLWIFGGWFDSYAAPPRDVWSSSDGRLWKSVTKQAPWLHSDLSMSLAFRDRLWMMGGWYNGRLPGHSASNAVWSSSDGNQWKQETVAAAWSPRLAAAVVASKDRMWMIGGTENYYFGDQQSLKNDVWSSRDGRHWELATDHAPWAPRAYHQAVVLKDRIYVLGGGNYLPDYQAYNDVWSSADGVDWRSETAAAPWRERLWFSSVVYRDHIWVLGGWSNHPSDNLGDVWYSKNGRDWKQLDSAVIWKPRHEHSAFVFQDRIWVAGGHARPLSNEVWSLHLPQAWGHSSPQSPQPPPPDNP